MASIYKRHKKDGSPRYVVRFRDPRGKKTERSAGSTKKAAENLKTRIERELADGTFGVELPEDPTLSQFCDKFLIYKNGELKESTIEDYKRVIKNHLNPYLGELSLSDIRPSNIQEFMIHRDE